MAEVASRAANEAILETAALRTFEKISEQLLADQRKALKWNILFKIFLIIYGGIFIIIPVLSNLDAILANLGEHAGVVKIRGAIDAEKPASAERIIKGLRRAFDNEHTSVIFLDIDSPGGSPVQAQQVVAAIKQFKEEEPDKKVIAAIGDVGASAAYYIASAADEIIASPASVVGSIGVRMDSFGLVEPMRKLGIERRLFTAGAHKGIMDMFRPLPEQERKYIKETLHRLHQQFITAVKSGRKGKLADDPELFSGLFWDGEKAKELGLVDEVMDRRQWMKAHDIKVAIDYTPSLGWAQQVRQVTGSIGAFIGMFTRPFAFY